MNIEEFFTYIEDELNDTMMLDDLEVNEDDLSIIASGLDVDFMISGEMKNGDLYFTIYGATDAKEVLIDLKSKYRPNKNNSEAVAKIVEGILWLRDV